MSISSFSAAGVVLLHATLGLGESAMNVRLNQSHAPFRRRGGPTGLLLKPRFAVPRLYLPHTQLEECILKKQKQLKEIPLVSYCGK